MINHTTMLHPSNEEMELIVYYDTESFRIESVTDFDGDDIEITLEQERELKKELEINELDSL